MKVETRLVLSTICGILVFLYQWIFKNNPDIYSAVVAFALIYFLCPYIFTRSFFFGQRNDQQDISKKKDPPQS